MIVAVAGVSIGMATWLQTRRMLVAYGLEATLLSVLGGGGRDGRDWPQRCCTPRCGRRGADGRG
ncbi:MAG: hypothetical protein U0800_13390 [Isosphaeraceae bacterium]